MSKHRKKAQQKAAKTPKAPQAPQAPNPDQSLAGVYTTEGVNAGNALLNKFMPGEAPLGRVSTDVPGQEQIGQRNQNLLNASGTSAAGSEALANMKAGLGGYTSPEYQAQREQMQRGLNSGTATAMNQLAKAQARGKVYGAAGVAQQQNLAMNAQNMKDQLEQDLMVKNIDEMRNRNAEYGKTGEEQGQAAFGRQNIATQNMNKDTMDLGSQTLDREKINLGQANTETASRIGLFTGGAGTALTNKYTDTAQSIQKKGIDAVAGNMPHNTSVSNPVPKVKARSRAARRR